MKDTILMKGVVVSEGGRVAGEGCANRAGFLHGFILGCGIFILLLFALGGLFLPLLLILLAVVAAVVLLAAAFIGWLRRLIFPKEARVRRL